MEPTKGKGKVAAGELIEDAASFLEAMLAARARSLVSPFDRHTWSVLGRAPTS